jgi:DNA/RNA endonuclease YhcR with UshA esterase domain
VAIAIFAYPCAAFINYGGWLVSNTKNPVQDKPTIIKQDNGEEKK